MIKGVPVSPGVVVAHALVVDQVLTAHEPYHVDSQTRAAELARFERACTAVARELDDTVARVSDQVGEAQADIFRAHRQLLRDPSLIAKVVQAVTEQQIDAATALQASLDEYGALFQRISDPYLQERITDLRDVVGRLLAQLARQDQCKSPPVSEPVILVAPEILPSQALTLDRKFIAALLTQAGSNTGHAAILARALGIPAISGISGLLQEIRTGDLVAMDAREGLVYINPGPEVEAAYRKLQREYVDVCGQLISNRELESRSPDGELVYLLANVSGPADAVMARAVGASGVGLYRTEYLFLTHSSVPSEDEQLAIYREVIESAPNRTVTIRTLDLGGDKHVPYLGTRREANPFMGFRSIRLSSAYPEFFQIQLRAILRAGRYGQVSLMFPMISMLEEVRQIQATLQQVRINLAHSGVPFADHLPIGIMIEVPAAALCIEELLDEVDFVSIGSNDLVQYLMAADRDNPQVAHLCEPFSPALLRTLVRVIQACRARDKPVTLCGEMAGWPRCFLPLFGAGLRRLSMSPAAVPTIKEVVRHTPWSVAQEVTQRVLAMRTMEEIRVYLTSKVREVWPDARLIDLRN